MAKSKVELISSGMKELLSDADVRKMLREKAELVAAAARASAPVATGAYRDGITVFDATTDRAVVRIGSTDRKAPIVEARTGNMARALDAAGG